MAAMEHLGGIDFFKGILLHADDDIKLATVSSLVKKYHPPQGPVDESILLDLSKSAECHELLLKAIDESDYLVIEKYITDAFVTDKSQAHYKSDPDDRDVESAFKIEYEQGAENALYDFLTRCNEEFQQGKYYGKFCSVVQSSGTGKSRTLIELRQKNVVVLYMSIQASTNTDSYPPRDDIVADILTKGLNDCADEYADRCVSFFIAVFRTLKRSLYRPRLNRDKVIQAWSSEMCDLFSPQRYRFFHELNREYIGALKTLREERLGITSLSIRDGAPTDQWPTPNKPTLSGGNESMKAPAVQPQSNVDDVPTSKAMPEKASVKKRENPNYEAGDKPYRPLDVFRRAINAFSTKQPSVPVWTVFASKVSGIADYSSPSYIYNSLRINEEGSRLFRPFSKLYWDQRALPPGRVRPADVAQFDNIVRFGRPLWQSLVESGIGRDKILITAGEKICKAKRFDPGNFNQALALLGQRFFFEICPGRFKSRKFQEVAVASHLRYSQGTTEDGSWQETSYPSEPLLSCAVARILYADYIRSDLAPFPIEQALVKLTEAVDQQLVNTGQKGELVSRLIYLMAKDLAVRKLDFEPISDDKDLSDCLPITVSAYLESVFGIIPTPTEPLELLEGWYINFSHWVSMSTEIEFSGEDGERFAKMQEWLYLLWTRTSAVQCCCDQKEFDKLIPMWHKAKNTFSYILIADKARNTHVRELRRMTPLNAKMPSNPSFYITVLAELGVAARPASLSVPEEDGIRVVHINAPGIGSPPYSFLEDEEAISRSLRSVFRLSNVSDEDGTEYERKSRERSMFGASCSVRHTHWKKPKETAS
ncbi:hypothetical protein RhiJN_24447 [Ceratobasidium sp. AG-Ba]|nr:hypothetical protein RhiJN_24447 [Ceratobasidium sp. AG-Ba]